MRRGAVAAAAVLLATSLAGCGSMNADTAASAFIAPGKFQLYTCGDVEERVIAQRSRQAELEQLMARASQGAGGEFASSIAYRSEYLSTRGELTALKQASADKQCAIDSKYSSGRALF